VVELYAEQTKKMSVSDLKDRLNKRENMVIMDAREVTPFFNGHIPGARSLFDAEIIPMAKKMDKDAMIVVYGPGQAKPSKNPMDRLAGDAIDRLRKMGFSNVCELEGGYEAWANAGNPVETSSPESVVPGRFTIFGWAEGFME
jgi:rhodanese-related sulfurtransferase